jgi:hypothetical protein
VSQIDFMTRKTDKRNNCFLRVRDLQRCKKIRLKYRTETRVIRERHPRYSGGGALSLEESARRPVRSIRCAINSMRRSTSDGASPTPIAGGAGEELSVGSAVVGKVAVGEDGVGDNWGAVAITGRLCLFSPSRRLPDPWLLGSGVGLAPFLLPP